MRKKIWNAALPILVFGFLAGDVRDRKTSELAMHDIRLCCALCRHKDRSGGRVQSHRNASPPMSEEQNVVLAGIASGVSRVIALSTDKAVNPINLYGASKLAAEKIFIAANNLSAGRCKFSAVRYGNVVGSRGSVLPFFQSLIARGETRLPLN
jgi:UDP-N-acetylglucosamine 4,6-dehydratase